MFGIKNLKKMNHKKMKKKKFLLFTGEEVNNSYFVFPFYAVFVCPHFVIFYFLLVFLAGRKHKLLLGLTKNKLNPEVCHIFL